MEVNQRLLLAALEGECPIVWRSPVGDKAVFYQKGQPLYHEDLPLSERHPSVCICNGTGRIPLLEGVREACRCLVTMHVLSGEAHLEEETKGLCEACYQEWRITGQHSDNCEDCQGRGWAPKREFEAWLDSVGNSDLLRYEISSPSPVYSDCHVIIYNDGWSINEWAWSKNVQEAFFAALTQVLKPLACNWEQAEEMARRVR